MYFWDYTMIEIGFMMICRHWNFCGKLQIMFYWISKAAIFVSKKNFVRIINVTKKMVIVDPAVE